MTMVGADPSELRDLGKQFLDAARKLESNARSLGDAVRRSPWHGRDAEAFSREWSSAHSRQLRVTASSLRDAAEALRRNAHEQETASDSYGGVSSVNLDKSGSFDQALDFGKKAWKPIGFTLAAMKAAKILPLASSTIRALNIWSNPAARSAMLFMTAESKDIMTGATGLVSKLGPAAKVLGPVGGLVSIGTGIHQMVSPAHDGWVGVGDRVAGGLSVISGAATLAMFSPLALTPAGPIIAGVAVAAGLASAAWNLGTTIVDNWDSITATAGKVGGAIADGASRAWNATSSFFKGIFG